MITIICICIPNSIESVDNKLTRFANLSICKWEYYCVKISILQQVSLIGISISKLMANPEVQPKPGSSKYNRQLFGTVVKDIAKRTLSNAESRQVFFKKFSIYSFLAFCTIVTSKFIYEDKRNKEFNEDCKRILRNRGQEVPDKPWLN